MNNASVAGGAKDAYRICLALADMKTKTIISKGVARALPEGIDPTPAAFFNDSPVFAKDASTDSYIKTCQGTKVGDNVDQAYADRIVVASLVNDGIEAYDAGATAMRSMRIRAPEDTGRPAAPCFERHLSCQRQAPSYPRGDGGVRQGGRLRSGRVIGLR